MTLSEFRAAFPEFDGAPDALVTIRLAWATARTPTEVWGEDELHDQGVGLLCAHMLALSPNARDMKLVSKDGSTVYGTERARLNKIVSSGYRVAKAGLHD